MNIHAIDYEPNYFSCLEPIMRLMHVNAYKKLEIQSLID